MDQRARRSRLQLCAKSQQAWAEGCGVSLSVDLLCCDVLCLPSQSCLELRATCIRSLELPSCVPLCFDKTALSISFRTPIATQHLSSSSTRLPNPSQCTPQHSSSSSRLWRSLTPCSPASQTPPSPAAAGSPRPPTRHSSSADSRVQRARHPAAPAVCLL